MVLFGSFFGVWSVVSCVFGFREGLDDLKIII